MKLSKNLALFIIFLLSFSEGVYAQFGFAHEIGLFVGPVAFQSDYGQRLNFSTNAGNSGIGIGIIHYLNFAYKANCNCYTPYHYFNNHLKLRTEWSYNKTNLKHFGASIDPRSYSIFSKNLRGMRGNTALTNIGIQLEYYPFSILDFSATTGAIAPFISLGSQFSHYSPKAYSVLGNLEDFSIDKYLAPSEGKPHGYSNDSGTVVSIISSIGTRYKLASHSDFLVDLRIQYYFSNWVDGLNPDPTTYLENASNDWLVWFSMGYIYYL